jgi:hypothetical protein
LQQPLLHEVGSHVHVPLVTSHSWPIPHGAHAAPAVPHEGVDSEAHCWHVPSAAQHPFGHDFASQTQLPVVLHSCPAGQAVHATPDAPHDVLDSPEYASHVPELQQPLVQGEPPHEQAPPEQVCPAAQAPHATPPVPHAVGPWAACATHCWVVGSQQPF